MRKLLFLLVLLALLASPGRAALNFVDNSNDAVDHGPDPTINNLAQGTILLWVNLDNAAANFRKLFGKNSGGVNAPRCVRVSGGNWQLIIGRATSNQIVEMPKASLSPGSWQFMAWTWDITNGGPKSYIGDLNTIVSEVTTGASDGSGAQSDDSSQPWSVGAFDTAARQFAMGMKVAMFAIIDTDLPIAAIRKFQYRMFPTNTTKVFSHYGFNGTSTQPDWSGNGNSGTVTGATLADHAPLAPPFGFDSGWHGQFAAGPPAGEPAESQVIVVTELEPHPWQALPPRVAAALLDRQSAFNPACARKSRRRVIAPWFLIPATD